jgi:hypothetical protein
VARRSASRVARPNRESPLSRTTRFQSVRSPTLREPKPAAGYHYARSRSCSDALLFGAFLLRLDKQPRAVNLALAHGVARTLVMPEPAAQRAPDSGVSSRACKRCLACSALARANGAITRPAARLDSRPVRTASRAASGSAEISCRRRLTQLTSRPQRRATSSSQRGRRGHSRHAPDPSCLNYKYTANRAIRTPNMTQYKVIETGRSGRPEPGDSDFGDRRLVLERVNQISVSSRTSVDLGDIGTATIDRAQSAAGCKIPLPRAQGEPPGRAGPLGKDGIKNRFPGLRV